MKLSNTFYAPGCAEWRKWLEENHTSQREIWLVYYKPQAGQPSISYEASVEEALCFGWIDSIIQKIDEEKYARKFNPRRMGSYWSALNKRRMEKLILEGRVTPAGLAVFDPSAKESVDEQAQRVRRGEVPIPEEIKQGIKASSKAWVFFEKLSPAQQRLYVGWIISAKKAETRQRRLNEAIGKLERGEKLGLT